MSSLAYLADVPITRVKLLAGKRAAALRKGGIISVADLLLHAPRRYIDRSRVTPIAAAPLREEVTVIATVRSVSTRRPRRSLHITDVVVTDGSATMKVTFFNQPFRERQLPPGTEVALSGRIETFHGARQMKSPAVDTLGKESLVTGRVVPVHPTVGGIPPWVMRGAIHNALGRARPIEDPIPPDVVQRHRLLDRDTALARLHFPDTVEEAGEARRRLVFDELFRIEVALALTKQKMVDEAVGITHDAPGELVDRFLDGLPFELTGAQRRVIAEIATDMRGVHPMHRLLLGEVGSGKTIVAIAALLLAVEGGYQGAVMAPTEVLATQHYLSVGAMLQEASLAPGDDTLFSAAAEGPTVHLALLTSAHAEVNFRPPGTTTREQLLEEISRGNVDIVVGTHALIQEGVHFANLGAAVVDEQHRFGVHQRVSLREKAAAAEPDLLIMTATPIPRTLSMTLYGDLDVSMIDEMPPGRPSVETVALPPDRMDVAYERVREQAAQGRQTFVVCPLVDDSPKVAAASAVAEHERLQRVFPDLRLGLLHGQMHPAEKAEVMERFRRGELDVLVSTTVIEVGIDIPNSTVMIIEDADRFGLSQLHQLRGRLSRHTGPNWCYLVADPGTDEGRERIAAMVRTDDGFELAEVDLAIRGQGTVFGAKQSGLSDLRLADVLRDQDLLVRARREAFQLVAQDPGLRGHPAVSEEVQALLGDAVAWLFVS